MAKGNTARVPAPYVRAIQMVKRDCKRYGVELRVSWTKLIDMEGHKVKGYFDEDNSVLAIGMGGDPFLSVAVLIHEHSHMIQWQERKAKKKTFGALAWGDCDRAKKDSKAEWVGTIKVELDAERRTLKQLRRLGVGTPAQLKAYTRAAILYVWSHHVLMDKKSWFKRSVSLSKMADQYRSYLPKTLNGTFLKAPPEPLYSIIVSWLK